jgi:hypothetical protein
MDAAVGGIPAVHPDAEGVKVRSAMTRSWLRAPRRPGAQADVGSSGTPFSVLMRTPVAMTPAAIRSACVVEPGSWQSKRIRETDPKVSGPWVKSQSASCQRTISNRARSLVSARVISVSGISQDARSLRGNESMRFVVPGVPR